jgi:tetratricopeptide (TPR) repeat protein
MPYAFGDRRAPRLGWVVAAALAASSFSVRAFAADPPKTAAPAQDPAAQAQADAHYKRASELYQQGAYREAIGELEQALTFDPNGKGLLYNLGVVHEKLGDIDEALKYLRRYQQMDLDPKERAKADAIVKRLEGAGARHEVDKNTVVVEPPPQQPPPPPPTTPPPPAHGRIDVLTIGAGVIAVAGIGVGTGFGLRAIALRPSSGFVTGRDGSYAQLQDDASKAHKDAIISDVGFATGIVAAAATAYLYFARTREPAARATSEATTSSLQVSGTVLPGGGAMILGGRF